ncbi:MAG TPA: hypothetical protein VJL88_01910 [Nitrospira sp.]|nr:hypothetical protein [Nitrospira sp.]
MSLLMPYTILLAMALSMADTALAVDKALPPTVSPKSNDPVAAGSLEDSLQACLARIPKDATAGQKMLAEQSCRRAEADRAPAQTSGGR